MVSPVSTARLDVGDGPQAFFDALESILPGIDRENAPDYDVVESLRRSPQARRRLEVILGVISDEHGRKSFYDSFKGFLLKATIWEESEEQLEQLLELCVLCMYFTTEEVEALRESKVKEVIVRVGRSWPGHRFGPRVQYQQLMRLGDAEVRNLGLENENVKVTFQIESWFGRVKTKTFLYVASHDAMSLHFVLTEALGWVRKSNGCLVKFGKANLNEIPTRGKCARDYGEKGKWTGNPLFDRQNFEISHCLAMTRPTAGTTEGIISLFFHSLEIGLNIRQETQTSAAWTDQLPSCFYFARTFRTLNNYVVFARELKSHLSWYSPTMVAKRKREKAAAKAARAARGAARVSPSSSEADTSTTEDTSDSESEAGGTTRPNNDWADGYLSAFTIKNPSQRAKEFVAELNKIEEHELMAGLVPANSDVEAEQYIIDTVNDSIAKTKSSTNEFQSEEFNQGELKQLIYELQIIYMKEWIPNDMEMGVFFDHLWMTLEMSRDPEDKRVVLMNDVLIVKVCTRNGEMKTDDDEFKAAQRISKWMAVLTGRHTRSNSEYRHNPLPTSYHGRLMTRMGICFDPERYNAVAREGYQSNAVEARRNNDMKRRGNGLGGFRKHKFR